jgi:hypothetical protein
MTEFKPQPVSDPLPQPGRKQPISFDFPEASQNSFQLPPEGGKFKQFFRNNKWYFLAIALGIVIIGTLAFFAFHKQTPEPTKNADVSVMITAPDTVPSGGEVIYKIQIDNNDPADLVDMNLELVYEDGMSYVSSTPPADNASGTRFPVPDLANDENVVLMIKTTVSGNINEDKKLVAKLRYKFSNFNSEFTEETTHSIRLVAADIILDVTGPEEATNVQTANYNIFYRNDSEKSIENARIQVTYPSEFKFTGSEPTPSLGQNIWSISNLDRNGTGKISFSGDFTKSRPGQSVVFRIDFLAADETGGYFSQSSTTYMTTITAQALSVEQRVQNENKTVVNPGESLQYELTFKNNTNVVATGLQVVVQFDSKAIDTSTIRAEGGLVQDATLTWNAGSTSKLERLNPGESGTLAYSVQLKNPAAKDGSKNLQVITKSRIKSNENQTFLEGNEIAIKVSSPSSIERSVSKVDGPVPPRVGQTTTLQVSVSLRNATNDYREGVLIGYVPLGVTFDKTSISSAEAAAVKFDTATGKLTWTVGQLAANSGSTAPLRTLKFNVKITPSGNQINQAMTLLKTISFSAKDAFTEQPISIQAQEITTDNLPGDGQGRVQP